MSDESTGPSRGSNATVLLVRLARLVFRDAARRYALVLVIAVAVLGWLERAWPAAEVRALIWRADAGTRIVALALVHSLWLALTHAAAVLVVRSRRLELWRAQPLPRAWWRRFFAIQLVGLDLAIAAVVAYAVAPRGAWIWVGFAIAWSLLVRACAVRAGRWWLVLAAVLAVGEAAIAWLPGVVALAIAGAGAGWALDAIAGPLPEPPSRRGVDGPRRMGATAAVAWLHARVLVRRRRGIAIAIVIATLPPAWLAGLGWQRVAAIDPAGAAALARGVVALVAVLAATTIPVARVLVRRELDLLDSLPIAWTRDALGAAVPALVSMVPAVSLLALGPVPLAVFGPTLAIVVPTAVLAATHAWLGHLRRRTDLRALAIRWAARAVLLIAIAVLAWPLALAWATLALLRLPGAWASARAVRRRHGAGADEDDHG